MEKSRSNSPLSPWSRASRRWFRNSGVGPNPSIRPWGIVDSGEAYVSLMFKLKVQDVFPIFFFEVSSEGCTWWAPWQNIRPVSTFLAGVPPNLRRPNVHLLFKNNDCQSRELGLLEWITSAIVWRWRPFELAYLTSEYHYLLLPLLYSVLETS